MAICKAVFPVAGLGTRLLPATKSQPKEMLPVGYKPVVQYVDKQVPKPVMQLCTKHAPAHTQAPKAFHK